MAHDESEIIQTSLKLNRKTVQLLDRLKSEMGASSKVEIIRKAIHLLEMAQQAKERGQSLAFIDDQERIRGRVVTP